MTAIAVTIGVAFLSGTLSLRDLLSATFSNLTSATLTDDVYVLGPEIAMDPYPSFGALDPATIATVQSVDGVKTAYASYQVSAYVYDENGKQANIAQAPAFGFNYVASADADRIIDGREPLSGEILIEESTSVRSGIEVGDHVHVVINEAIAMDVVGIVEFGSSMAGASIILLNEDDLIEFAGPEFSQITVIADDGVDPDTLKERLIEVLPSEYGVSTAEESRAESDEAIAEILNIVNTFLLVFVVIALAISTFIITNTFTISVRQRQRQFALLRAVGASPRQVFQAVLVQAIVIGLIGSLLGVVVGQGLLFLIKSGLESNGMPLDGSVVMRPQTALISIVTGTFVTFLATIMPSRRAALTPAIEAMREGSGQKEKPLLLRSILATVLLIGGTLAMVAGAINGQSWTFGLGVAAMFIGVIGIMPALLFPVVAVLGWVARKLAPATGVLASRSLIASPRKTATTAVALAIGVALVSAGSSVAASLKETMYADLDMNYKADLLLIAWAPVQNTEKIAAEIASVDGVELADASFSSGYATIAAVNGVPVESQFYPTGGASVPAADGVGLVFSEGSVHALEQGEALIYDFIADEISAQVGDEITIASLTGSVTLPVGGIVETGNLTFGNALIMIPPDFVDTLAPEEFYQNSIVVYLKDDAPIQQVKEEITALVKDEFVWQVADRNDIKTIVSGQVSGMLNSLYALLALSVVIAVLGVVNTLTLSVVDRTREIGLLRAVGLSRSRVRRMIAQESLMITMLGTVVGVVFGVALGLGLTRYMAEDAETTYVIPWDTIGVVIIVALIVGVLAAVLPARKAAKLDVLAAIAEE
ncbi:MAG: FtsX-like permease family protein [Arcanobacterium sp.]